MPSMAFWPPALPLAAIVLNPGDPTNDRRVMFRIQEYTRLFLECHSKIAYLNILNHLLRFFPKGDSEQLIHIAGS